MFGMSPYLKHYSGGPFSFSLVWMHQSVFVGGASKKGSTCQSFLLGDKGCSWFNRCDLYDQTPPALEEFVVRNDDYLYSQQTGLAKLIDRAEVRLINSTNSLRKLHDALKDLDLKDQQRLRPSWDQYFMQLASLAAQRSNCMKRRVGCVLVREQRVISTGYNGTPRNLTNCNEGGCTFERKL